MSKQVAEIKEFMLAQHPLHGMMAEVFEEMGGKDWLKELAEEYPRWFFTIFTKMTPSVAPTIGMVGDLNITINSALIPTDLDSVTLDERGMVIEVDAVSE